MGCPLELFQVDLILSPSVRIQFFNLRKYVQSSVPGSILLAARKVAYFIHGTLSSWKTACLLAAEHGYS